MQLIPTCAQFTTFLHFSPKYALSHTHKHTFYNSTKLQSNGIFSNIKSNLSIRSDNTK